MGKDVGCEIVDGDKNIGCVNDDVGKCVSFSLKLSSQCFTLLGVTIVLESCSFVVLDLGKLGWLLEFGNMEIDFEGIDVCTGIDGFVMQFSTGATLAAWLVLFSKIKKHNPSFGSEI